MAKFRNCGRIELAALKWNPAVRFYERLGFEALHEWQTFRLEGESIGRLTSDRASITP